MFADELGDKFGRSAVLEYVGKRFHCLWGRRSTFRHNGQVADEVLSHDSQHRHITTDIRPLERLALKLRAQIPFRQTHLKYGVQGGKIWLRAHRHGQRHRIRPVQIGEFEFSWRELLQHTGVFA